MHFSCLQKIHHPFLLSIQKNHPQKYLLLLLDRTLPLMVKREQRKPDLYEKIQAMGPKYVVIKKGEHGALLFHKDQVFFAPALPLEEVYDPTGAGDTFAWIFSAATNKEYSPLN